MPQITGMKMRRGRPERFIIEIDSEEEFIFTPETVLKHGIAPEKQFSVADFKILLDEDSQRQAEDQAMRYLSIRPHSRFELKQKLIRKGYQKKVIERALDRLTEIDLLNDNAFTRLFIQNELRLRPVSRALLKQKLIQKGIDREISRPLLEELYSGEEELGKARQLSEKFLRTHSYLKEKKLKEKLIRFLQGKGFTWEHISQVVQPDSAEE